MSSSMIIPLTTSPDLVVVRDVHTYIVCGEPRVWSASIASASASPNRPSSMNGVLNAFTICAWPVISAPGATCPPLLGIVDGRCAACNARDILILYPMKRLRGGGKTRRDISGFGSSEYIQFGPSTRPIIYLTEGSPVTTVYYIVEERSDRGVKTRKMFGQRDSPKHICDG